MSNWHHINIEEISGPHAEEIAGVEVTVYWSNDDIPKFAKTDLKNGIVTIKFRYDAESTEHPPTENLVTEPFDSTMSFKVGERSGRLYEISLRNPESTVQSIVNTLSKYSKKRFTSPNLRDNAQAVEKAIWQVKNQLQLTQ